MWDFLSEVRMSQVRHVYLCPPQIPLSEISLGVLFLLLLSKVIGKRGPWKSIWRGIEPTKVKCFTWLRASRACLTHEPMQRNGIYIALRCSLCKEAFEINNHLFPSRLYIVF